MELVDVFCRGWLRFWEGEYICGEASLGRGSVLIFVSTCTAVLPRSALTQINRQQCFSSSQGWTIALNSCSLRYFLFSRCICRSYSETTSVLPAWLLWERLCQDWDGDVGLGGLGVTCSPPDPRFASSNSAEVDGFLQDFKLGVPCLRFQAR